MRPEGLGPGRVAHPREIASGCAKRIENGCRGLMVQKVTISIPLDADTSRAYESAAPAERRRIEILLGLRMRELANGGGASLQAVLDRVGRKAVERGLTQETLDSLLG